MAESQNFFNRSFGLNVQMPTRTIEQFQETATKNMDVFSPLFKYLENNDTVFSGNVAEEINKMNQQLYNLGSIMRQGKSIVTFDTNG